MRGVNGVDQVYRQVFVESLDSAFENVCELDLVFNFDEVCLAMPSILESYIAHVCLQAHHILAEIIQGGLVLETNVTEIDRAGTYSDPSPTTPIPSQPSISRTHAPLTRPLPAQSKKPHAPGKNPSRLRTRSP